MSVLSGPAAAALYGSNAASGVILITTKKGKEGKARIIISNNSTFSNPFIMPEFQNSYINRAGSFASWGDKASSLFGTYEPKDFSIQVLIFRITFLYLLVMKRIKLICL